MTTKKTYKTANGKHTNHNPANKGSKWITRKRRFAIYERDDHKCVYCGIQMEDAPQPFTLDHIVPCELGGSNASGNLVSSCKSCNAAKGAKSQRAFFKWLRETKSVDTDKIKNRIRRNVRRALKGNFKI